MNLFQVVFPLSFHGNNQQDHIKDIVEAIKNIVKLSKILLKNLSLLESNQSPIINSVHHIMPLLRLSIIYRESLSFQKSKSDDKRRYSH